MAYSFRDAIFDAAFVSRSHLTGSVWSVVLRGVGDDEGRQIGQLDEGSQAAQRLEGYGRHPPGAALRPAPPLMSPAVKFLARV